MPSDVSVIYVNNEYLRIFWRSGSVTRASGLRPRGSIPGYTKDFKKGIGCSFLEALSFAPSIEKAELVGPVSV